MAFASGDTIPLTEMNDRLLLCTICHERYKTPKILNCLHTFCEGCLGNWVKSKRGRLTCPSCRDHSTLPVGGVSRLRDNTLLNDLIEIITESSSISETGEMNCEHCGKNASYWCDACDQAFCNQCDRIHVTANLLKGHERITIEEYVQKDTLQRESVSSKHAQFCSVHIQQKLTMYCHSCEQPICRKCKYTKHKKPRHLTLSTEEARQMAKPVLNQYTDDLARDAVKLNDSKDYVTKLTKTLLENRNKVERNIQTTAKEVRDKVDAEEAKLLRELDDKYRICDNQAQTQLEQLDMRLGHVESMQSYFNHALQHGTAADLISAVKADCTLPSEYKEIEQTKDLSADLQFEKSEQPAEIKLGSVLLKRQPSQNKQLGLTPHAAEFVPSQNKEDDEIQTAYVGYLRVVGEETRLVPKKSPLEERKPLPSKGACVHFSLSFRWFKFPCCGETYPCNICHDLAETHRMQFAKEMICGFCRKTQPYTPRDPCISCGNVLAQSL